MARNIRSFTGNGFFAVSRNPLVQFVRYSMVGFVATIYDFALLVILVEYVNVNHLLANVASYSVGTGVNYLLSIYWVFSTRNMKSKSFEFTTFAAVGVVGFAISEGCMFVGVNLLGIEYTLTKAISVFFTLCWNFTFRKLLLFRDSKKS